MRRQFRSGHHTVAKAASGSSEAAARRRPCAALASRLLRQGRDALHRCVEGTRFGTITSVRTNEPVASLTFDDGPHPHWTPRVLDVLDEHGAKATFFVVGEHVDAYPDVVRRIRDGGHAVGNHSHRHPSFPLVSSARRRQELRAWEAALAVHAGAATTLFRPPFLDQDVASRVDAWRLGYDVVACSVHANDWQLRPADDMADELTDRTGPGDVIMLHDAIYGKLDDPGREPMVHALAAFLARRTDLRFVTVPSLLTMGESVRTAWFKGPRRPDARIA